MSLYLPLPFKKIKISIFTPIVIAAILYSDFSFFTLEVFFAAIIHEAGHLTAMKLFGVNIHSVTVLPYGVVISSDSYLLPYKKEAVTALAGIVFNIITGITALIIRHFTGDIYTLFFAVCSFFLAFVNLIPIQTLDGARALEAVIAQYCDLEKKEKIMENVYYSAFIVIVLASLYMLEATDGNFSLIILLCCFFISVYAGKAGTENDCVEKP